MVRDNVVRYAVLKYSVPKPEKVMQYAVRRKWRFRNPDLCRRLISI